MSSASDPHSILNRNPEMGLFKVPQAKAKVTRYYPGVAPATEYDSDDDIFESAHDFKSLGDTSITSEKMLERLRSIEEVASRPIHRSEKAGKSANAIIRNVLGFFGILVVFFF